MRGYLQTASSSVTSWKDTAQNHLLHCGIQPTKGTSNNRYAHRLSDHSGSAIVSHFRYAFSRNSSIHSGSFFLAEIARTTSSSKPFGKVSLSMIVFQPALYGLHIKAVHACSSHTLTQATTYSSNKLVLLVVILQPFLVFAIQLLQYHVQHTGKQSTGAHVFSYPKISQGKARIIAYPQPAALSKTPHKAPPVQELLQLLPLHLRSVHPH